MNFKKMFFIFTILFWFIFASMVSAANYVLDDNGALIGATDIIITDDFGSDVTYNVMFQDGIAHQLFYDDTTDEYIFTFNSHSQSLAASEAILIQIYCNDDSYDNEPGLTNGLDEMDSYGLIMTPYYVYEAGSYDASIHSTVVRNTDDKWVNLPDMAGDRTTIWEYEDEVHVMSMNPSYTTWAIWVEASSEIPSVPEPATIFLLGLGLVGLSAVHRKKIKTA